MYTSEQIRELILHRIAQGFYRPGDRLPGIRATASEFGVNRNTVSKVYQQLRRASILRAEPGRRLLITRNPQLATEDGAEPEFLSLLRQAMNYARSAALPIPRMRVLLSQELEELGRSRPSVAFIECNKYEAKDTADRMTKKLGSPVDHFVLGELPDPDDLAKNYPILATTFYHLSEVQAWLGRHSSKLVGLQHEPSADSVLEIARIPKGTRIGVAASNERTLNVLTKIVETYHHNVSETCLARDKKSFRRLVRSVDVVVLHPLARQSIRFRHRASVVTVNFQIESQSLEYLRRKLGDLHDRRQKRVPAA